MVICGCSGIRGEGNVVKWGFLVRGYFCCQLGVFGARWVFLVSGRFFWYQVAVLSIWYVFFWYQVGVFGVRWVF